MASLRSLPRLFLPGVSADTEIELPREEIDKLRKVLRLSPGGEIAVLPDDGSLIHCRFNGHSATPIEVFRPNSEANIRLTVAQALPKGDKIDEIVRACTELGAAKFVLFPSDRTVVQWDERKTESRLARLRTISREAAEVSFRTRLPLFELSSNLADVLSSYPEAQVLSEVESVRATLAASRQQTTIVVGPEGGWSQNEVLLIGNQGITLGPRVLRVDHAAPAAAALLLLR